MDTQKKTWEIPQLIILAKGTPEETLTTNCKVIVNTGGPTGGPVGLLQDGCNLNRPGPSDNCGTCQGRSGGIS